MIDSIFELWIGSLPLITSATGGLFIIAIFSGWAITHPQLQSALIATGSVVGCGLFIGQLTIFDEVIVAVVVGGILLRVALTAHPRTYTRRLARSTSEKWHYLLYSALVGYFILQSVRGAMEFGEPRKLRWVVFFMLIGVVALISYRSEVWNSARRHLTLALTVGWIGYLALYIGWGVSAEVLRDVGRFSIQPGEWGTPSYSLSPLIVAVPAALLVLRDEKGGYRVLGAFALTLTVVAVFYYDARVGLLALMTFAAIAGMVSRKATAVIFSSVAIIAAISINFLWNESRDLQFFLRDTFESGSALIASPDERSLNRDYDRVAHIELALTSIDGGVMPFLFGYGYRTSGDHIGGQLDDILESYGRTRGGTSDNVATEAFTALVLETGVVGVALVVANLGISVLRVWRGTKDRIRIVILCSGSLLLGWTVVINFLDAIWLFLAIAPMGIFVQMGMPDRETHLSKNATY